MKNYYLGMLFLFCFLFGCKANPSQPLWNNISIGDSVLNLEAKEGKPARIVSEGDYDIYYYHSEYSLAFNRIFIQHQCNCVDFMVIDNPSTGEKSISLDDVTSHYGEPAFIMDANYPHLDAISYIYPELGLAFVLSRPMPDGTRFILATDYYAPIPLEDFMMSEKRNWLVDE